MDAQLVRAASLAGMKKLDEAVGQVESAIEAEPLRVGSHLDLGILETIRGNKDAAEQAFNRAVEANPKSVPAKLALANFYWMGGRNAESEAILKELDAAQPNNVQINRALAAYYLSTRQAGRCRAAAQDDSRGQQRRRVARPTGRILHGRRSTR